MSAFQRSTHSLKWIPVKNISVVWAQAQRPYDPRQAKRIAAEFDPDCFGTIKLTMPDDAGMHHCVDGQHRVGAVRDLFGPEECVPCLVAQTRSPERAAVIFSRMNNGRTKPSALHRFRVDVTSNDPTAVAIEQIIARVGFHVGSAKTSGCIRSIGACCSVYRRLGADALETTLLTIRSHWGMDPDGVDGMIIAGYAAFLATYGDRIDAKRLSTRMQKDWTAARLCGAIRNLRQMFKTPADKAASELMVNCYDAGLRSGRLSAQEAA